MNILILTGKFGMGHESVARALSEEILSNRNHKILRVDILDYLYPQFSDYVYGSFNIVVNKYPELHNKFYDLMNNGKIMDLRHSLSLNRKIDFLIKSHKIDLVISTMPLSNLIMSNYKAYKNKELELVSVITDIEAHSKWIFKNIDHYLVPSKSSREDLLKMGIDSHRIHITGIPLRKEFQRKFEITGFKNKKVLILGGGLGLIPNIDRLLLALRKEEIEVTIVTGKNLKLKTYLEKEYPKVNVLGFVDDMDRLMEESNYIISKAGGITSFEAIKARTPIVVIEPFLKQEIENSKFIEKNRIGRVVWNIEELEGEIASLFSDEISYYRQLLKMEELTASMDSSLILSLIDSLTYRDKVIDYGDL